MLKFRIECRHCQALWSLIGTQDRLKGRLLINPHSAVCYLCEKASGLPAKLNRLWWWNEPKQKWEPWKGENE